MSTALRPPMSPVGHCVRAYFAPVDRLTGTPAVFDPAQPFDLDAPPVPWLPLGSIDRLKRVPGTRFGSTRAGAKGAPAVQFRQQLEARVEFDFRDWGKLQMALAGGSQHLNVLACDPSAAAAPSGGTPLGAIAVLPGSTAQELVFGEGAVDTFTAGDLLAIDLDYADQTGYVGSGVAAAYVGDPAEVAHDADYIRRVTFNLGRVASKTATSVVLAQSLIGGAPPAGARAQKVIAFVDREGGSFFPEWSALFVLEEVSGGRLAFYYPRLQPAAPAQESVVEIAAPIASWALHASFLALPFSDLADGETCLCWRSYFPAATAAVY